MGMQDLDPCGTDSAGVTQIQYRAAVAEFDALWEASAAAVSRARMDALMAVIDAYQEGHAMKPAPGKGSITSGANQQ
jgi:predicted GTPase